MEVVEGDRDSKTDWTFQVALAESGAEKESRDVVVVTDLRLLRIVLLKRVAADIAMRRVLILFPLLGTHTLHRAICPELFQNRRLPLDEYI